MDRAGLLTHTHAHAHDMHMSHAHVMCMSHVGLALDRPEPSAAAGSATSPDEFTQLVADGHRKVAGGQLLSEAELQVRALTPNPKP